MILSNKRLTELYMRGESIERLAWHGGYTEEEVVERIRHYTRLCDEANWATEPIRNHATAVEEQKRDERARDAWCLPAGEYWCILERMKRLFKIRQIDDCLWEICVDGIGYGVTRGHHEIDFVLANRFVFASICDIGVCLRFPEDVVIQTAHQKEAEEMIRCSVCGKAGHRAEISGLGRDVGRKCPVTGVQLRFVT